MADVSTASTSPLTTKEIVLEEIVEVIGEHALDTVTPDSATTIPPPIPGGASPAPEDDFVPCCITQTPIPRGLKNKNLSSIMVSLNHECPRWVPGSVIKWVVVKEGFKTQEDADYAAQHLHMACEKWNEMDVGVRFEWVRSPAEATFALWHGGSQGGCLASAFFPNPNDLSNMLVYSAAFSMPRWKANLWKVFTHELGHVLGLRHEFALDPVTVTDPETGEVTTTVREASMRAVQLGPRNEKSVMSYSNVPPEIQPSDVESTRAFYALRPDVDGNMPKVGGLTEIQDYEPM
ncbi:hypothetical protein F5Y17DRAFT_29108 [Xylariaceae sp. FL0594]|nr:hypothetical protein F5Y17DRAFT_29108 [Xylariaceae sp. FL0594]